MNASFSAAPPGKIRRLIFALIIGCGVAAAVWVTGRFNGPGTLKEPAPERTSADLIRRDGVLCEKGNQRPFTGWLTERYADGSLHSRSWLSSGVLQGISEGWYTNGVLEIQQHFVAGLSEGRVIRWRDDGSKLSESEARAGKLEGLFQRWHPNGQLAEQVTFRGGEPHGLSRAWFPSGGLRAEVQLDGGKVVTQQFWKEGENDGRAVVAAATGSP